MVVGLATAGLSHARPGGAAANAGGQREPAGPASLAANPSVAGPIAVYEGRTVAAIRFRGMPPNQQKLLENAVVVKTGQTLRRGDLRESIKRLFASGRFQDIRVEAVQGESSQVELTFVTLPNSFIGDIKVEGAPARPTYNQIVNASKLQLGEVFGEEKLARALRNIKQLLQDEGYYRAEVTHEAMARPDTQQLDVRFRVEPGPQARVGLVTVTGDSGYSQGQVQDIGKIHPGERVSAQRGTRALQRLRKKFEKQSRLLAQVSISQREYHAATNVVDYTFKIDRGPTVEVGVEGFRISRGVLKNNVPVYEEGSLDDDLLNEGRRNLLDYLQTRGYFDSKVAVQQRSNTARELRVTYLIDPGPRHKLLKVAMEGNKYFDDDLLRSHMQIQPASRFFSHGKFSQGLLNSDTRTLQDLYRANGFREVQIKTTVEDNYLGQDANLALVIHVVEGPQTLVGRLEVTGNNSIPEDQLPILNTAPGQPFSEPNIVSDRESILNFYFNRGFPNATFDTTYAPSVQAPYRMDVKFSIREGEQFFVNQVLLSGTNYTQPSVVEREISIEPQTPLSQQDLLDTQRRLYDLGLFTQVDTAVQNPEGNESHKNILVDVHEAQRYTFEYGLGFEFQTSQPSVGSNQPQGGTGVSPRLGFAVTRLNFRGRAQTLTFKGNVGSLQQRGLFSFDAPKWLNPDLRLTFTAFYDNTVDVTTFSSQRLESSVQLNQTLSRTAQPEGKPISTLIYRYTFRRVKASDVVVASDQIPLYSQPTRVGIPGFTYLRDKRDNPVESTRGNYTTLDGGVAGTFFGSEADFGRLLFQNSTYQPFGKNRPQGKKYVFARSTTIGIENPFGDTLILNPGDPLLSGQNLIPLPERFFSGGGNSHRGFGLNQAGPRDPTTGFPLGGSALFLNNLELRFPPLTLPFVQDNVSLAIFHDSGNVFSAPHNMAHSFLNWRQPNPDACMSAATAKQCNYNYIAQAIGVGVRYRTPIGPVRFDFGYNLTPPAFPSFQTINNEQVFIPQRLRHFNLFFSIGQTF